MKKTLTLLALMLICFGTANAGELKVQIPVNDYEKIQSRLDALENENNRLIQEVRTLENSAPQVSEAPSVNSQIDAETAKQLTALENENDRLKQEITSLQNSQGTASSEDDIDSRLSSLENENIRLNQKIKSYKERGVRIIDNDRRTARQVFRDMRNK